VDEVLHLHLLELGGAKDEVLRLISCEGLPIWAMPKVASFAPSSTVGDVREVRWAVSGVGTPWAPHPRPDRPGLEHQVEGPWFGELVRAAVRTDAVDLVLAPALFALLQSTNGRCNVSNGPTARWRAAEDRGVQAPRCRRSGIGPPRLVERCGACLTPWGVVVVERIRVDSADGEMNPRRLARFVTCPAGHRRACSGSYWASKSSTNVSVTPAPAAGFT